MQFENVIFSNFPELDEVDQGVVQKNIESFFSKVLFLDSPKVHFSYKSYAKGGLRQQHEIHAKLTTSTDAFFASEVGWQLLEVLQNSLKKHNKG